VEKLAGNTQRDGQVRRADHDGVQARNGEQFAPGFHRPAGFDLKYHHGVLVHVPDDLGEMGFFVTDMHRRQSVASHTLRRKARPPYGRCQQLRRLDPGKDHPLRSAVERARHQGVLHVRDAHQRT
jgi:hypothetical protein